MCTNNSQCSEGNVCVEGQCVPRPIIVDPIKPRPDLDAVASKAKKKTKK